MKSNIRTSMMKIFAILFGLCLVLGISFGASPVYADTENTPQSNFNSIKIIGSQLRLDDEGIRFIMEMDSTDYNAYKASKEEGAETKYNAGILIIPRVVLGNNELTLSTASTVNIEFADDYVPKAVDVEGGKVYRFFGVLNNIPVEYAELCARGYVTGGDAPVYTNLNSNSQSRISANYYVNPEYANYKDTLAENVINAYNAVTNSSITSIDQITLEPTLNSANSLIVGKSNVEGYSDVLGLPKDIGNVFAYTITNSDDTVVSVDTDTNKLTALKYGSSTITVSAMGKDIGSIEVYTMDKDLVKIGFSGASSTSSSEASRTISPNNAGKAQTAADAFLTNNIRTSTGTNNKLKNWWAGTSAFDTDADYGKIVKGVPSNVANEYFMFNSRYTKEQLAMLLASGYDVINIPIKVDVEQSVIEGEALAGRTYVGVYSPAEKLTGLDDTVSFRSKDNQGRMRVNKLRFGEWGEIQISLKTLIDNYDRMLYANGDFDGTAFTSGTRYSWIAIDNKLYGGTAANFAKTISFADVYLLDSSENAPTDAVNLNSNVFNESFIAMTNKNASFATSNGYDARGSMMGRSQDTITAKKNGVDTTVTANFVYMSNSDFRYGFNSTYGEGKGVERGTSYIYLDLDMTKAQLEALKEQGYANLSFDICYKLDKDKRVEGDEHYGKWLQSYALLLNKSGKASDFDIWYTWTISIDDLITNYDALFVNTGANRLPLIVDRTNAGNLQYIQGICYTLYMTGFTFVK